jgi:hypothetical protein
MEMFASDGVVLAGHKTLQSWANIALAVGTALTGMAESAANGIAHLGGKLLVK